MSVQAKMTVSFVKHSQSGREVELYPIYADNGPNKSWSQATPSGKLTLMITNPDAYEQFVPGKTFLLTFEEVDA